MRIGHISTGYKPIAGGQETYIANLFRVLEKDGHSQHVYQMDTGVRDPEIRPVPSLPRWLRYRALVLYGYNALLMRWARELAREDLLIVHYGFHYPPVAWHPRVVVVSHGVEWEVPPRTLHHRVRCWASRWAFARPRVKFVSNDSDFLRQMGVEHSPGTRFFDEVCEGRWFVPNCVDTDVFYRTEAIPDLAALHPIVVPRNIVPRRGLHLAIESFARFWPDHKECHLVVVGGYEDPEYRRSLESLAGRLGVPDQVVFWGHVPWRDMPRVYSSAHMTIIPSLFGEGTSLSAVEAMACESPTIGTRVGGLADLPCYNVEPETDELARAMNHVFENREAIAREQSETVREVFNLTRWGDTWLSIVRSCR